MYIYKDRNKGNVIRRYYKYQENDFIQPILGENGILGGDFFAVAANGEYDSSTVCWKAFDNNSSTKWAAPSHTFPDNEAYIIMYNPLPIKVMSFDIQNSFTSGEVVTKLSILASNDNKQWLDISEPITIQDTTALNWNKIKLQNDNYYKYYKINLLEDVQATTPSFTNIKINGLVKNAIISDKNDFDFFRDKFVQNSGWANIQREKKYFKYRQEEFVQPELTENGMLGGSTFAVFASSEYSGSYQAYMAFDTSTSSEWAARGIPSDLNYIIYNPDPLYITEIEVTNRTDEENITSYRIEGAGRDKNWVALSDVVTNDKTSAYDKWKIVVGTPDYYNYYKISILTAVGNVGITNLKITGKTRNPIETSETDYDYSVDVPTVKLINKIGYRKG